MSETKRLDRLVHAPNREIRVVGSLVILVLAAGFAMLWPSVQHAVVERFGPKFPAQTLVAELIVLVLLFVAYLWRKSCQVENLVHAVVAGRDRSTRLETSLAQARSVLQASGELQLDEEASESLQKILACVIDALQATRGVMWRQRADGRPLEREAVFPSTAKAPDPLDLAFEDEIAHKVVALKTMVTIDEESDLAQFGVTMMRPKNCPKQIVAAPLVVDGKPAGVMLLCNPHLSVEPEAEDGEDGQDPGSQVALLEVFVGFAAGVLRNLRKFQVIAKRNDELNHARKLLDEHQRELAEIDAVATMSRVARSLAHGLAGPLTAIAGYTDIVATGKPDTLTLQGARDGLRREIGALKTRLRQVVDFTQSWRRQYTVVDVNDLVETAVALQAESMRARNISCKFEPHAGLPFTVADPARLRQVFLSVLGFVRNVLAGERGPHEVRVRTLADTGRLKVHVEFPGRGGMKEIAAPLLDPNVEITTLTRERSIDLPVAVAIVRDHQGDLQIEMLEDHGSRIVVDLPIQDDAPVFAKTPSPEDSKGNFESILARIFSEPPVAPRPGGVKPGVAPASVAPRPAVAPAAPVAAAPAVPRVPNAADAAPRPAPASAPVALPVAAGAGGPPPVTGADQGGIDSLFNSHELWKGVAMPTKVETPAAKRPTARRTLLDEAEVEGALKLFDDAASQDPAPKEPDGS
jgi:C4-dicarboxylate-specific signal transduction histidine kinase